MEKRLYKNYIDALVSGDRRVCQEVVDQLLQEDTPVLDIYVHVFQQSMYDVGRMWEDGVISVAVEHMATAITERLLAMVYPRIFQADHIGRSAVISCAPTELHQIGARMVADAFELSGWDGYFLGANTPEDDLFSMVNDKNPDILAVSVSLPRSLGVVFPLLDRLQHAFPRQNIIVGGQALADGAVRTELKASGVRYLSSLEELRQLLATF
jgi:MerR family transcriptional regulator, light-induced transcriptional regulator